jgi:hypothetical protein
MKPWGIITLRLKPHIWKSQQGYWLCHGITDNAFTQGYGNTPKVAYDNFILARDRSNRMPRR